MHSTLADTDGHDNTVRVGQNDSVTSYEFSEQDRQTVFVILLRQ